MIQIGSEVGRLRKVLLHEPGLEVDHMVPATMDELLFDDVLFGDQWVFNNTGHDVTGSFVSGVHDADIDAPEAWA